MDKQPLGDTYEHTPAGIRRVGCMIHEDCLEYHELGAACVPVEPYEIPTLEDLRRRRDDRA